MDRNQPERPALRLRILFDPVGETVVAVEYCRQTRRRRGARNRASGSTKNHWKVAHKSPPRRKYTDCQADDSCAAPSSQVGMIALAGSASARACTTERPSSG